MIYIKKKKKINELKEMKVLLRMYFVHAASLTSAAMIERDRCSRYIRATLQ